MAELTHTNVPVHLLRDDEGGLVHFMAEVDGVLFPIASLKTGTVQAMVDAAPNMSVQAPGAKKSRSTKTASTDSE